MSKVVPSITLSIGIIWALACGYSFLALAGISTPVSSGAVVLATAEWFVGPISFIVGSVMFLSQRLIRISLGLSIAAALILSGIVTDTIYYELHPQPLEAPPSYGFYTILISITILCDLCVFWLTLNWKQWQQSAGANAGGA